MPDTRTFQFTWSPSTYGATTDWYCSVPTHMASIYIVLFKNEGSMVATIRPIINGQASLSYEQGVFPSVEEAKAWCEAMILTGAV